MSTETLTALVVDDDQSVRWVLEKALRQAGIESRSFERAEHLLEAIDHGAPDVLVTDVRMPGMNGITLLERLNDAHPELPIIVITAHSDLENAVAAYKGGAFEYLPKPFDIDEAVDLVRKAAREAGALGAKIAVAAPTRATVIMVVGDMAKRIFIRPIM